MRAWGPLFIMLVGYLGLRLIFGGLVEDHRNGVEPGETRNDLLPCQPSRLSLGQMIRQFLQGCGGGGWVGGQECAERNETLGQLLAEGANEQLGVYCFWPVVLAKVIAAKGLGIQWERLAACLHGLHKIGRQIGFATAWLPGNHHDGCVVGFCQPAGNGAQGRFQFAGHIEQETAKVIVEVLPQGSGGCCLLYTSPSPRD